MKELIKEALRDTEGSISSKRLTMFTGVILFVIVAITDIYFDRQPSDFVWEGILYIVLASLGMATLEKFTPYRKGNKTANGNSGVTTVHNTQNVPTLMTDSPTNKEKQK